MHSLCVFARFLLVTNERAAEQLYKTILQKSMLAIQHFSAKRKPSNMLKVPVGRKCPLGVLVMMIPCNHLSSTDTAFILLYRWMQEAPGLWSNEEQVCDFGEDFIVSPLLLSCSHCPACCLQELPGLGCGSLS